MIDKTRFNVGYAIAAIFAIFLIQYVISTAGQTAAIPYSEYQQLLRQGKVASVGISDRMLQGTLKVDREVRAVVDRVFQRAQGILKARRAILDRAASKLLKKETLEPSDLELLVRETPQETLRAV